MLQTEKGSASFPDTLFIWTDLEGGFLMFKK